MTKSSQGLNISCPNSLSSLRCHFCLYSTKTSFNDTIKSSNPKPWSLSYFGNIFLPWLPIVIFFTQTWCFLGPAAFSLYVFHKQTNKKPHHSHCFMMMVFLCNSHIPLSLTWLLNFAQFSISKGRDTSMWILHRHFKNNKPQSTLRIIFAHFPLPPIFFPLKISVYNVPMNMEVQIYFWDSDFVSFGYILRRWIAGSYSSSIFNFWEIATLFCKIK